MVNGLHLYSAFPHLQALKVLYNLPYIHLFIHSHLHSHGSGGSSLARQQPAHREEFEVQGQDTLQQLQPSAAFLHTLEND